MATLQTKADVPAKFTAKDKEQIYTIFAVVTIMLSILILMLIAYLARPGGIIVSLDSIPFVALVIAAILSAVGGLFFLDASNPSAPDVILPSDRDLLSKSISAGDDHAVTQYLRLRNMRGVTGFFQKLGLPGLPIATIFITLFFTVLALSTTDAGARAALFDFAKLTLGAFIGSFVQRSIDPSVQGGANGKGQGQQGQGQQGQGQQGQGQQGQGAGPQGNVTGGVI